MAACAILAHVGGNVCVFADFPRQQLPPVPRRRTNGSGSLSSVVDSPSFPSRAARRPTSNRDVGEEGTI